MRIHCVYAPVEVEYAPDGWRRGVRPRKLDNSESNRTVFYEKLLSVILEL